MAETNKRHYPFVWFDRGGWWFKAFNEHFGPYECPGEARHNLLAMGELQRHSCTERRVHPTLP